MRFKIKVPASTSNIGPGFDSFGIALNLYNEVDVWFTPAEKSAYSVQVEGEGKDKLAAGRDNMICRSMERVFRKLKGPRGRVMIRSSNSIPLSSGLGSSSTAIVAGLAAANRICGDKLSRQQLIDISCAIEGHPDNVTPAIAGGFCVACVEKGEVKYVNIPVASDIRFILCMPRTEVSTKKARKILPKSVALKDAVFNIQRSSLLVGAFVTKRYDLISTATADCLHQPYRKKLVPGYDKISGIAKKSGALGVFISGSGPSIAIIAKHDKSGNEKLMRQLASVYESLKISSNIKSLSVTPSGLSITKI